jgi:hypothetical protein
LSLATNVRRVKGDVAHVVVSSFGSSGHTDSLDLNRRNRELAVAKSAEPRGRAFPISTGTASRAPWRQVCERAVSQPLMTLANVLGV